MAELRDDTYDPGIPEANRNIQQGGGSGARDLARQRDPGEGADDAPADGDLDPTPDQD